MRAEPRLAGTHRALLAAAFDRLVRPYDRALAYELGEPVEHPRYQVGVVVGRYRQRGNQSRQVGRVAEEKGG